jgi:hypothetical protein
MKFNHRCQNGGAHIFSPGLIQPRGGKVVDMQQTAQRDNTGKYLLLFFYLVLDLY